jgi:pyruvate dehydrogenase E2 component (dihydrolipoamide acetyltransferase)
VVPVIRDVDRKGLIEIAGDLTDLGARAGGQAGRMRGGTFTISSLGGIGGTGLRRSSTRGGRDTLAPSA